LPFYNLIKSSIKLSLKFERPPCAGGGIGVMGVGSLLFALPHLLADSYSPATGAGRHKTAPLCNMTIACGIEEGVSQLL
jgi:hypothetical protein